MTNSMIRVEIPEGKVKAILDELSQAQETIYRCYSELQSLGVVNVHSAAGWKYDFQAIPSSYQICEEKAVTGSLGN